MIQPTKPSARIWRPNILIFGASGTGKTRTWLDLVRLTGARAMCMDTHHGTDAWGANAAYHKGWDVVHSSSPDELEEQIDHYLAVPSGYTMFVVDDISVAYTELQDRADDELRPLRQRKDSNVGRFGSVMDPGSWSQVKRMAHVSLNKLTHLDMARVVVARSKPHYTASSAGGKLALERKGMTWSGDKDMEYSFDLVIQLEKYGDRRVAVIEKARGMPDMPSTIEDFTAEKLLAHLPCGARGFTDPATPAPVVDADQATELRALFARAAMEPGRQARALAHYGATSFEDVPLKNLGALTAALAKVIADTESKTQPQTQTQTAPAESVGAQQQQEQP